MRISIKSEYALRALLELAVKNSARPLSIKEICRRQNLPLKFTEQLFRKLKKQELIKSKQGPKGGYLLAKPPVEITLHEILTALEDNFQSKPCQEKAVQYCSGNRCNIYSVLENIETHLTEYFQKINLESIINSDGGK